MRRPITTAAARPSPTAEVAQLGAYGTAASGVLADNRLWQYNADGSVSPGPVPGWPTLPGWDMTTGFGSPRAAAFVAAIRAARNTP